MRKAAGVWETNGGFSLIYRAPFEGTSQERRTRPDLSLSAFPDACRPAKIKTHKTHVTGWVHSDEWNRPGTSRRQEGGTLAANLGFMHRHLVPNTSASCPMALKILEHEPEGIWIGGVCRKRALAGLTVSAKG
jgi:hypothetical protein